MTEREHPKLELTFPFRFRFEDALSVYVCVFVRATYFENHWCNKFEIKFYQTSLNLVLFDLNLNH